jgi:hypothetical protein
MQSETTDENAARVPNKSKRMSVSLSDDAARLLESLATTQGITQTEALRKIKSHS